MDRITETILTALKQALTEQGEQRLFRAGKLSGLFPGRTGASAEAAARALQDGLLELTRTEIKGKTNIEWVRLTPKGVNFLHDQESPIQVLRELRRDLQTTREGIPTWLAQLRQDLQTMGVRLAEEVEKYVRRLDGLSQRVEEALRRADALGPNLPDGLAVSVPWGLDALGYLDRRREAGANGECPLPELFSALHGLHPTLTLTGFHDGLRRLADRKALRLMPPADAGQLLPEPEHALLDGEAVLYYAAR